MTNQRTPVLPESVGDLQPRIDQNNKGFVGYVTKWGVLVGLLAATVSIVVGALNISNSIQKLHPKPDTRVFAPEDAFVSRSFDSENEQVTVKINCIITNSGDADDLIVVKSQLKVPGLQNEDISHSFGGDFEVLDQTGRKLSRPFILPKATSLELTCSMTFNYSERSAAVFEKEGMRRLTVTFPTRANHPSSHFCYDE